MESPASRRRIALRAGTTRMVAASEVEMGDLRHQHFSSISVFDSAAPLTLPLGFVHVAPRPRVHSAFPF